jgi:hypothetical protein
MKYLVELLGGPRHPEMVNVYLRLVGEREGGREREHSKYHCNTICG